MGDDVCMTGPWPDDSATVERWVRAMLEPLASGGDGITVSGLERMRIDADLAGSDLQSLTVDATPVEVRIDAASAAGHETPPPPAAAEPVTVQTRSGVLRRFRISAHPLRIERTPVDLHVEAHDVPIEWSTFAEPVDPAVPESIHAVTPKDPPSGVRGAFDVSLPTKDAVPLITGVLRPALQEAGLRPGRVSLSVDNTEDDDTEGDGIRIQARVGVRWKFIVASARLATVVEITPDAVVTVRELTVRSRHPLVALALRFVRSRLRAVVGSETDLNAELARSGTGVRIHDLRVTTGERLGVAGRFSDRAVTRIGDTTRT